MALFFPEWIPWWLQLAMVGIVVIFILCFLLMPFSVFGLKSRLTYLDHQMEDIQAQLRVLLKRIPDSRERLEFKLQPVSTGEDKAVKEGVAMRGKSPQTSSEYFSAVPSTKSRPTCFDPPSQQPESSSVRSATKITVYEENHQIQKQECSKEQDVSSVKSQRMAAPERREEQIYDPPQLVKENKQEGLYSRRRAEPILRWPQK